MKLWTFNLWPNNLLKTYPLFSPRSLVLLTSPLFLWKLAIFGSVLQIFKTVQFDFWTLFLSTLNVFILKIDWFFHIQNLFYKSNRCHLFIPPNNDIVMPSWWQNDDTVMNSEAKNLHVILFLLLKIIIWPVLKVIPCSWLILLHFLFFKDFTGKLRFYKIGFWSCSCNWRSRVTTALKLLQIM